MGRMEGHVSVLNVGEWGLLLGGALWEVVGDVALWFTAVNSVSVQFVTVRARGFRGNE